MSKPDPAQRIEELRARIRHHEERYYIHNDPEIADEEFDRLLHELERLEAEHPDLVTADSPTVAVLDFVNVSGEPESAWLAAGIACAVLALAPRALRSHRLLTRRHVVDVAVGLTLIAAVFLVVMLSSIGLPGTNGFVGEFLVLLGSFRRDPWWAMVAASGVILSAVYMLWMFQRVFFGPVTHAENERLSDLSGRERLVFAPLLLLIFWMGVYPQPILDRAQPTLDRTIALCKARMEAGTRVAASEIRPR